MSYIKAIFEYIYILFENLIYLASTGSPYFGADLPVRVAITETLNVKFIGVGDQNTKMVTNAEIYLGRFIPLKNFEDFPKLFAVAFVTKSLNAYKMLNRDKTFP